VLLRRHEPLGDEEVSEAAGEPLAVAHGARRARLRGAGRAATPGGSGVRRDGVR
jgi:hypothetical protein